MIELNLEQQEQLPILEEATARGIGLLVKKGLASGRAEATTSLRWLLGHQALSSVVIGSMSAAHMQANCLIAETTA